MKIKSVITMSSFFSLCYDLFASFFINVLNSRGWPGAGWYFACATVSLHMHEYTYAMPLLVSVAGLGQLGDILHVQLFSCTCMNTSVCNAPVSVSCWT